MECLKVSMNEKRLVISLNGQINARAAQDLVTELDVGFAYYQYPAITVRLDSPGGDYTAMRTLMNAINTHRLDHHPIHVHAAQVCASAAALVLAHGAWGTRTVEPYTQLLFHWVRASFEVGQVLTSDMAASLAKGLSAADQKTFEQLVGAMSNGAGSNKLLVHTMSERLDELLVNWHEISRALVSGGDAKSPKQLVWLKELQRHLKRWTAETDDKKRTAAIVSCLKTRFELDLMMDLREAYVMGLIDVVRGVLPWTKPVMVPGVDMPKVISVTAEKIQARECHPKSPADDEGQPLSLSSQGVGTNDHEAAVSKYSERGEA